MASISQLESLLARVRRRAAEPRPVRPASRVALRSYAEIDEQEIEDADLEDDEVEEYKGELVEIVDEPFAPAKLASPAAVARAAAAPSSVAPPPPSARPAPVPVRQSPIPASPATQRSEPPPPPLPLPSMPPPPVPPPPPSWGSVAARAARRSVRPMPPPPPSGVPTAVSAKRPSVPASIIAAAEAVVERSPVSVGASVAESRGQRRASDAAGFDELLERSLELGR